MEGKTKALVALASAVRFGFGHHCPPSSVVWGVPVRKSTPSSVSEVGSTLKDGNACKVGFPGSFLTVPSGQLGELPTIAFQEEAGYFCDLQGRIDESCSQQSGPAGLANHGSRLPSTFGQCDRPLLLFYIRLPCSRASRFRIGIFSIWPHSASWQ